MWEGSGGRLSIKSRSLHILFLDGLCLWQAFRCCWVFLGPWLLLYGCQRQRGPGKGSFADNDANACLPFLKSDPTISFGSWEYRKGSWKTLFDLCLRRRFTVDSEHRPFRLASQVPHCWLHQGLSPRTSKPASADSDRNLFPKVPVSWK